MPPSSCTARWACGYGGWLVLPEKTPCKMWACLCGGHGACRHRYAPGWLAVRAGQGSRAGSPLFSMLACRASSWSSIMLMPTFSHWLFIRADQGGRRAAAVQHDRRAVGGRDAVNKHATGILQWPVLAPTHGASCTRPYSRGLARDVPFGTASHLPGWLAGFSRLWPRTPCPFTHAAPAAPFACCITRSRSPLLLLICAICPTLLMSDAILCPASTLPFVLCPPPPADCQLATARQQALSHFGPEIHREAAALRLRSGFGGRVAMLLREVSRRESVRPSSRTVTKLGASTQLMIRD